jgi:hypothetical protein
MGLPAPLSKLEGAKWWNRRRFWDVVPALTVELCSRRSKGRRKGGGLAWTQCCLHGMNSCDGFST